MEKSPEQLLQESAERDELRSIMRSHTHLEPWQVESEVFQAICKAFGHSRPIKQNPQTYFDTGEDI